MAQSTHQGLMQREEVQQREEVVQAADGDWLLSDLSRAVSAQAATGRLSKEAMQRPGLKRERVGPTLWTLDRIDQRLLPLDGLYTFGSAAATGTGEGVTIYAVDSGVYAAHQEFLSPWAGGAGGSDWPAAAAGNASEPRVSHGYDFVDDDEDASDCDGHGTHTASTAIGRAVGAARAARLVAVRALDCEGSGTVSTTVAGLDWVARHARRPAVVMLSLGVPNGTWSRALSAAVRSLAGEHGLTVVAASGNAGQDACGISPADVEEAITVGASSLDDRYGPDPRVGPDRMYRWANTGPCMDLFAPGVEVFGACGGESRCPAVGPAAYTFASGTSMAVPLVAGVACQFLQARPLATPSEVAAAVLGSATRDALDDARMLPGTPNLLLFSRGVLSAARPDVAVGGGLDSGGDSSAVVVKAAGAHERG